MTWTTLSAAPHRVMFLAGGVQAVLVMLWWLAELGTRFGLPLLPPPALPAATAHAWLMLYGLLPFFIFGFAFTAVPNWLSGPKIARGAYLACFALTGLGAVLFYPGLYLPALAGLAVALHATGLGVALVALLASLRGAQAEDRRHAWAIWAALLLGLIGELAWLGGLATDRNGLLGFAEQIALWGFLLPVFLTVCHRMVPWFTSRVVSDYRVYRPYGLLWAMLAACLGHAALATAGQTQWLWLVDLPLALIALVLTARWGLRHSLPVRLLAMLHIAFVWAGLGFALSTLASLGRLLGWDLPPPSAATHALAIGFFGAMVIGMASRVSLGHSGHALAADALTWRVFWLVQLAALARILPEWLPGIVPYALIAVAGIFWLLSFAAWGWRYLPLFWRPRADGKPG